LLLWSVGTGYVRKRFQKRDRKRRSSAEPIGNFKNLAYSSKVQAALEGYNHDICQQQITTLQTLSRPRFPWYVNSEVKMQIHTPLLTAAPVLTYQRLDARIEIDEPEFLRPEHIEALLGEELPAKKVALLRKMDINDPDLLDILYRAGEALGAARLIHRDSHHESNPVYAPAVAPDWPPPQFDPPSWQNAAASVASSPPEQA
jgi:hypothetical protein